jgi:pyruvate/2-oxoglutarate dehydrogenase complex dihydrolipoamide acyltransferase (E2) component
MLLRFGIRLGVRNMITTIKGQTISKGTLIHLPKKIGDSVQDGEVIAIVEMDKMAVNISSSTSGVISGFRVSIGEIIFIGDPIVIFDNSLIKHIDVNQEKKS